MTGGITAFGHEVLGPGWIDDGKGGGMPQPVGMQLLAQRAIGDVFEQLERVGRAGREKALPAASAYYQTGVVDVPLTRDDAAEMIRLAENALDYARVHLPYLPADPSRPARFHIGDQVMVIDEDNTWSGTIVPSTGLEPGVLSVRADDGQLVQVDERDLREVAQ